MTTFLMGILVLANAGLRLTSGWPLVLDVPGVRAVESRDARVVLATQLDASQVLLIGGLAGSARVSVEVEQAGQVRLVEYDVRVVRTDSVVGPNEHVELDVDAEKVLRVPGLRRVASGDSSVCEAMLTKQDELRLVSRRPGRAVLVLWVGGTSAVHRRALVVTAVAGGLRRTEDDFAASLTEPLDGRLALIAGEHARVQVPGTRRFQSRDPGVAAAHLSPSGELVVEARGVGATWVQLWDDEGAKRRLWVVVNHHSSWDPHSIDWLLRLEAERRAQEERDTPAPLEDRSRAQ